MKITSGRIWWAIFDEQTAELCMLCETRDEARALAKDCGIVLKIERVR